jgi:hypothetical protein
MARRLLETAEPVVFWGLLGIATLLIVMPFWVSAIPPFYDIGGHLAMADAWARLEEVPVYQEMYARRTGLVPNTVFARFAGWMHPFIAPLTSLRIFMTLVVISTVGSLYACARTFDRSVWLLFLALPFCWNGSMYIGMVNYVPIFPLFFAGIAFGAKTGDSEEWWWGVGLSMTSIVAFFVHGLGVLFVVGVSAFMLLLSLNDWKRAAWMGGLVPTVLLWLNWRSDLGGKGTPDEGIATLLERHANWFGPKGTLDHMYSYALDIVQTQQDLWLFIILVGVWMAYMGVSAPEEAPRGGLEIDGTGAGWWRYFKEIAGGVRRVLYRHRLLVLLLCLWAAIALLPGYIKKTDIKMRLIAPFFWTAALLPRIPRKDPIVIVATVVAIGSSMWFGQFLTGKVQAFQRQELASLTEIMEDVPESSRVQCLDVYGRVKPIFHGRPLAHNCAGLLHARRSSYGGFAFPGTGFNPIKFREGRGYHGVNRSRWTDLARLQTWDYLIIRGSHAPPPDRMAEQIAVTGGDTSTGDSRTRWTLYRIEKFGAANSAGELAGGSGGFEFRWSCPDGTVLVGFSGRLRSNHTFGTLTPKCRRVSSAGSADGDSVSRGPSFGTRSGGGAVGAVCPSNEYIVGLSGSAGTYVDRVNLACSSVTKGDDGDWRASAIHEVSGGESGGGEPFEISCPPGQIGVGFEGRHGGWIDAVGLLCEPIEKTGVAPASGSSETLNSSEHQ